MELNREQIIKGLELWIKNFDGKVTDFKTLTEATLLINKLTEENERLQAEIDNGAEVCHNCHTEYADKIEQAKADTVREMQERLKMYFGTYVLGYKIPLAGALAIIDQIAKKMLEGVADGKTD